MIRPSLALPSDADFLGLTPALDGKWTLVARRGMMVSNKGGGDFAASTRDYDDLPETHPGLHFDDTR
jgi:hypothetical protein